LGPVGAYVWGVHILACPGVQVKAEGCTSMFIPWFLRLPERQREEALRPSRPRDGLEPGR
jgi:hypothetical protein